MYFHPYVCTHNVIHNVLTLPLTACNVMCKMYTRTFYALHKSNVMLHITHFYIGINNFSGWYVQAPYLPCKKHCIKYNVYTLLSIDVTQHQL